MLLAKKLSSNSATIWCYERGDCFPFRYHALTEAQ